MRLLDIRVFSFFAIMILCVALITGCDKDNPTNPEPGQDNFLWVHFKADSSKIAFDNLPKIDADGEEAIQLSSFIDTMLISMFRDKNGNLHEARRLYSIQVVGDDGFSASAKGYPNNTWEHLTLGHILTQTRLVVFPDDKIDLAGAYNVKNVRHIYIHRKFDVSTSDTTAFVELRTVAPTSVTNPDGLVEDALPLKEFVTSFVAMPENFQFSIMALDGYTPPTDLSWDQFQTGYWLLTSEKSMFTDSTVAIGKYQLKVLEKIMVK